MVKKASSLEIDTSIHGGPGLRFHDDLFKSPLYLIFCSKLFVAKVMPWCVIRLYLTDGSAWYILFICFCICLVLLFVLQQFTKS